MNLTAVYYITDTLAAWHLPDSDSLRKNLHGHSTTPLGWVCGSVVEHLLEQVHGSGFDPQPPLHTMLHSSEVNPSTVDQSLSVSSLVTILSI